MPSISATSYTKLRTCPRLYYYEQVLYMQRAREEGARPFGTLYHKGLEAWWSTAGEGDAPWANTDAALVAALAAIAEAARHADTDKYERAAADALMIGYHVRWAHLAFTRIGVGVEDWFESPLVDPDGTPVAGWKMIGRKDAIVQFLDKPRASVVEHKHTKQDITFGAPYWERVNLDTQIAMYIDNARQAGTDAVEVLWDVSKRPDVSPSMATPVEQREYTQGKGCKECGGSAGGKNGIKQGAGVVENSTDPKLPPLTCEACSGTGWKKDKDGNPEAPRLYAKCRETDETPEDYGKRVAEQIARMPEAHYKQASVQRDDDQIAESRADLCAATVEIDNLWARARKSGDVRSQQARRAFARNTSACFSMYGRRCDWLEVCSGQIVDPLQSQLYRIKPKRGAS